MKRTKNNLLLSTAAIFPIAFGLSVGVSVIGGAVSWGGGGGQAYAQGNPCNPCAAKKPCNPCNPCAAKKPCNPCNPCAAKKPCNPCNPCAANNPCNPCRAGAAGAMESKNCVVPGMATGNPCNPCAAKKPCNPCNPCAAKKPANPCNPCAAKKPANPCNPCAAKNPCNPCNPCAAAAPAVNPGSAQLNAAYDCVKNELRASYRKAGIWVVKRNWTKWARFNAAPYRADTHGGRFVNNYANRIGAKAYGTYDKVRKMPVGSTLVKDSFTIGPNGKVRLGPVFIMEKMGKGFNAATANWRYAMVMPGGKLFGITGGKNSKGMGFCQECHAGAEENDMLFFLPGEFRR